MHVLHRKYPKMGGDVVGKKTRVALVKGGVNRGKRTVKTSETLMASSAGRTRNARFGCPLLINVVPRHWSPIKKLSQRHCLFFGVRHLDERFETSFSYLWLLLNFEFMCRLSSAFFLNDDPVVGLYGSGLHCCLSEVKSVLLSASQKSWWQKERSKGRIAGIELWKRCSS